MSQGWGGSCRSRRVRSSRLSPGVCAPPDSPACDRISRRRNQGDSPGDRSRSSAAAPCRAPAPLLRRDRECRACPAPFPLRDAIRGKPAASWARSPPAAPRSRPARAAAASGGARRTRFGSASKKPPRPGQAGEPVQQMPIHGQTPGVAAALRAPPAGARAIGTQGLAPSHQFSVLHIFDLRRPSGP